MYEILNYDSKYCYLFTITGYPIDFLKARMKPVDRNFPSQTVNSNVFIIISSLTSEKQFD